MAVWDFRKHVTEEVIFEGPWMVRQLVVQVAVRAFALAEGDAPVRVIVEGGGGGWLKAKFPKLGEPRAEQQGLKRAADGRRTPRREIDTRLANWGYRQIESNWWPGVGGRVKVGHRASSAAWLPALAGWWHGSTIRRRSSRVARCLEQDLRRGGHEPMSGSDRDSGVPGGHSHTNRPAVPDGRLLAAGARHTWALRARAGTVRTATDGRGRAGHADRAAHSAQTTTSRIATSDRTTIHPIPPKTTTLDFTAIDRTSPGGTPSGSTLYDRTLSAGTLSDRLTIDSTRGGALSAGG